ncbi:MAG: FAD binding domain-containing protein [Acidimicrobiales bacterium]|nr:FAD binding domain-containing protein [Acidimicrobiales bacterium]MCB9394375.1 FAD binding domain-containing protein [Acidimicrobiaceae bacterium]
MSLLIATTVDDALAAMAAGARPIAGGSDLVVGARHGKAPLPDSLVAIDRIAELRALDVDTSGAVRIGAGVSHHLIESHPVLVERFSALADAAALVGSPSTRHVGTIGGNVMNASPAMDTGAPLVVLGASVELRAVTGSRTMPIGELWIGPGRTAASPDELCVAVHLPAPASRCGSAYVRLEYRRAMEIAVVGAAASVTLAADGTVTSVHAALTAVAPTIIAVAGLEHLAGATVAEAAVAVGDAARQQATPISDVRASDRYRRHTIAVMAQRAVDAAARRAAGERVPVPVNRALGIGAATGGPS